MFIFFGVIQYTNIQFAPENDEKKYIEKWLKKKYSPPAVHSVTLEAKMIVNEIEKKMFENQF